MARICWIAIAGAALVLAGCGTREQSGPAAQTPTGETKVEVVVKTLDSAKVATIGRQGPYQDVGKTLGELFAWAGKNNVRFMGPPFGVFVDDPAKVSPESTKYSVCIRVPEETEADQEAGVAVRPFGGIQVASTVHVGPFDKVCEAYDRLRAWIEANGYVAAGPALEFYLSDPEKTPADQLQTEVCLQVLTKQQ